MEIFHISCIKTSCSKEVHEMKNLAAFALHFDRKFRFACLLDDRPVISDCIRSMLFYFRNHQIIFSQGLKSQAYVCRSQKTKAITDFDHILNCHAELFNQLC